MAKKDLTIFNLPNVITIARIAMVPAIIWGLFTEQFLLAFILFTIAGASDFIDGWLARFQKIQTVFGAFWDPIADKLLMGSTYLTLGILGHIPLWLVLLVIFRDLFIVGGIAIARMLKHKFHIAPLMISKINTLVQICLVILVLADLAFVLGLDITRDLAYITVAATTIISTFAYLIYGVQQWRNNA